MYLLDYVEKLIQVGLKILNYYVRQSLKPARLRKVSRMKLFTIGYEGLNPNRFLKMLKFHRVTYVADVRQFPASRKKGFSKTSLKNSLAENKIQYENFRTLGVPKDIRDDLKQTGNYSIFFKKYKNGLKRRVNEIDQLLALIHNGEKMALMCFEGDFERCHRKALADEIKKRDGNGLGIKHLKIF